MISIILSIIGAVLYRVGGSDLPLSNKTKYRDAGTSLCGALILFLQNPTIEWKVIGSCILAWGLGWGAMTTYFKKKGTDAKWYNWLFVGIAFSLVPIFYAWTTGLWIPFAIRSAVLVIAIPLWCEFIGWDVAEEFGRGFLFCVTLLMFNLGG